MNFSIKGMYGFILPLYLVFANGCAFTDAHVDLAYFPDPGKKSPLSTVSPLQFVLQVEDQRPAGERSWVGNKKNRATGVIAWVKSNKEVTTVIRDAIKNELVNNAHKVADSGDEGSQATDINLLLSLKRYWSDIRYHFWDIEILGALNADFVIQRPQDNSPLSFTPIEITFRESHQIATDGAYEDVLNGALSEFVRSFSGDPNILKTLRQVAEENKKHEVGRAEKRAEGQRADYPVGVSRNPDSQ